MGGGSTTATGVQDGFVLSFLFACVLLKKKLPCLRWKS